MPQETHSQDEAGPSPTSKGTSRPRTISALTAQQVQHKRDLDRKAQRALRQRMKTRVQDLEEDLNRANQSSSEREKQMLEEIQTLREQNRRLKSKLESIGQFAMEEDTKTNTNANINTDRVNHSVENRGTNPGEGRAEHPELRASGNRSLQHHPHPHHPPSNSSPPITDHPITIASIPPKHTTATCPLDQILLDFLSSCRSMAAKGFTIESIIGPEQPCMGPIVSPELALTIPATSRVLADVMATFGHVEVPEKVAFMYLMHRTMRWQISLAEEDYARLPDWARPTATQIAVPHAPWIDNIPWPRIRDILIQNPSKYPFALFSELYSRNVTVNWPYDAMDTVIVLQEGKCIQINPIFEKHILKLGNWTVADQFREYLPEIAAVICSRD